MIDVTSVGFAGEIEARYLAGAGVGALRVSDNGHAAAARAVDAEVRVEVARVGSPSDVPAPFAELDAPVREVAEGALRALAAVRAVLAIATSSQSSPSPREAAELEG
jgi:hypothetical protein